MIEDIIIWPLAYSFEMLTVWWSFTRPFEITPYIGIPTLLLNTVLIILLVLFVVRTLHRRGRLAIQRIILMPVAYWLIIGVLSLPVELAWHRMIEGRYLATHDYVVGFHPFSPPITTDFRLDDGTWVQTFIYSKGLVIKAKSGARDIGPDCIIAIWAILAVAMHYLTYLLVRRLNSSMEYGWQPKVTRRLVPEAG